MLTRLRTTWLAAGGATLLVLSLTGIVGAMTLVLVAAPQVLPTVEEPADTTATFEDADGNNVDDDCQDAEVAPNPSAAASAQAAVDANGDGVISTSEAAQSDRTGGTNCNHGGYVSNVARQADEDGDAPKAECSSDTPADTDTETPTESATTADASPNAHGKAVSKVAQDQDAVGGKNCNHGGAVSEVAKNKGDHPHGRPDATRKDKHPHGRGHNKA
ncbi:MAG TPA: hypothetical protein VEO91_03065 [Candidatus Limnocylindria bacterium]|nr:hypothetical protein [Candidatus Limnocylindria bacterium]